LVGFAEIALSKIAFFLSTVNFTFFVPISVTAEQLWLREKQQPLHMQQDSKGANVLFCLQKHCDSSSDFQA